MGDFSDALNPLGGSPIDHVSGIGWGLMGGWGDGDNPLGNLGSSLTGGGSVLGGLTGSDAAKASERAAQLQYDATIRGQDLTQKNLEQTRADFSPYRDAGQNALTNLGFMQTFRPDFAKGLPDLQNYDFNSDPLIQAMTNRTTRAVGEMQAAKGKLGSGGTLTAMNEALAPIYSNRLNQLSGIRNQLYNERFRDYTDNRNNLMDVVRMGQASAGMQAANSASGTNALTDLITQGGNALAAGQIGAANAQQQGSQNMLGLAALAASFFCDRRCKENVDPLYVDDDGLTVYGFNYRGGTARYVGKMAQDIIEIDPAHVVANDNGYLMVTAKYAPTRVA